MEGKRILIVEDEQIIASDIINILEDSGYMVVDNVVSGEEVMPSIEKNKPDLILMDIIISGGYDGIETAGLIKEKFQIPVVYLTAHTDEGTLERAKKTEPYGFIIKPFTSRDVHAVVEMAYYKSKVEKERNENLEKIKKAMLGTLKAISLTVEYRDPYTAGHQRRVADLARAIAERMGLSDEQIDSIMMAGIVHDIGKISIPAEILSKPSRLLDTEFEIIKTHPKVGCDILSSIEFPYPIDEIVYQHHERMDGSGYPEGLEGERIHIEARVLAVADVVEAMSSHRPYRAALGIKSALHEIRENRGVLYDPDAVDACVNILEKGQFKFASHKYSWQDSQGSMDNSSFISVDALNL